MKKYNLNKTRRVLNEHKITVCNLHSNVANLERVLVYSPSGFWITVISYGDGTYGFIDDVLDTPRYFDTEDKMLRSLLNCPLWNFCY